MTTYYPIFVDLSGRSCVVVGGGPVAQRKVTTLLRYGAQITVISRTATPWLKAAARQKKIRYVARRVKPADLRRAWLVYAATDDERVNELVSWAANRQRVFANVVDQKPLCSFIAPSIFTRGLLTIAVSTGGVSPTLAKRLRRELGQAVGSAYAPMLRLLAGLRGVAKRTLPHYHDRKRYFDRLVDGRTFELVRSGKSAQAHRHALRLLETEANGTRGR